MAEDKNIIEATKKYVRSLLEGESSGHDWWHIDRVVKIALAIAREEAADETIVYLSALLHDIADYKMHNGNCDAGLEAVRTWLEKQSLDGEKIEHICAIIEKLSFKGAATKTSMDTLEGKIVQDADRLDAIGAVGIARVFAFGGSKGREIYSPEVPPVMHGSFEEYKNAKSSSINHFHEKLLLLRDRMNTPTAKKLAEERHEFMLAFLDRFHKERDGEG